MWVQHVIIKLQQVLTAPTQDRIHAATTMALRQIDYATLLELHEPLRSNIREDMIANRMTASDVKDRNTDLILQPQSSYKILRAWGGLEAHRILSIYVWADHEGDSCTAHLHIWRSDYMQFVLKVLHHPEQQGFFGHCRVYWSQYNLRRRVPNQHALTTLVQLAVHVALATYDQGLEPTASRPYKRSDCRVESLTGLHFG